MKELHSTQGARYKTKAEITLQLSDCETIVKYYIFHNIRSYDTVSNELNLGDLRKVTASNSVSITELTMRSRLEI